MEDIRVAQRAIIAAASLAFAVAPQWASAIEAPLGLSSAQAAVSAGAALHGINESTIAAFDSWDLTSHADGRLPTGYVSMRLTTPYEALMLEAAQASGRYETVSQKEILAVIGSRKLTFTAHTTSMEIDSNDGATIVIEQAGKIVQPERSHVDHAIPDSTFRQTVTADFDGKKLDLAHPFTVILANVDLAVRGWPHEFRFSVDPAQVR